ncbi:hypothetical protein [Salinibaculum rarum]|uniref:hypothetical protein n=1 Tax=Salinibaculum rarum TaxID=3058903 RepID=UPI00265EC4E9|nr:hypothetical protein [Salinibaculum sp. KK48]
MPTRLDSPHDRIESLINTVETVSETELSDNPGAQELLDATYGAINIDELVAELSTTEQVYWITILFEEYGVDTAYIVEDVRFPTTWRSAVESMFRDALVDTVAGVAETRLSDNARDISSTTIEQQSYGATLSEVDVDAVATAKQLAFEAAGRVELGEANEGWEARYNTLDAHRDDIWDELSIVEIAHLIEVTGETFNITDIQETDQFPGCADSWENVITSGILWHHLDAVMQTLMDDYDVAMQHVGENTAGDSTT